MSSNPSSSENPVFVGWFCILLGLYPIAIATKLLPLERHASDAPMWVIFLTGVVFLLAGIMVLWGQNHPKFNNLCAAILLAVMSSVGIWVSMFAPATGFSGGIPFLSAVQNVAIGRCVFGLGSLITVLLCGYAIRLFFSADS